MNNLLRFRHRDLAREEAALWVVRIKDGLSPDQEKELEAWLRKHRDHGPALVEIATAWDELDLVEQLSPPLHAKDSALKRRPAAHSMLAYAAIVALCVLAGWFGFQNPIRIDAYEHEARLENPRLVFDTAIGEQSKVAFPDGSNASLNTNSRISVEFSGAERRVVLHRGEAHFAVKRDYKRPFVVLAGGITIRALGTAFNVSLADINEPEVVVTEGKVAVYSGREENEVLPLTGKVREEIELSAGEMVRFREAGQSVSTVDRKSLGNRMAWTSGMMVFVDEPLEKVIEELGRYTETKLVIGDPGLTKISVAGYFRVGDVDALLFALAENFGIGWQKQDDNSVILTARRDRPVD